MNVLGKQQHRDVDLCQDVTEYRRADVTERRPRSARGVETGNNPGIGRGCPGREAGLHVTLHPIPGFQVETGGPALCAETFSFCFGVLGGDFDSDFYSLPTWVPYVIC